MDEQAANIEPTPNLRMSTIAKGGVTISIEEPDEDITHIQIERHYNESQTVVVKDNG